MIPISSSQLGRDFKPTLAQPILLQHKIAHSLEDSAHFLLDEILKAGSLETQAVVI